MGSPLSEPEMHRQKLGLFCTSTIAQSNLRSPLNLVCKPDHRRYLPFTLYQGNVLGIKEESRMGAVMALWNYIKIQGLQDKVDRRMVRADNQLRPVRTL